MLLSRTSPQTWFILTVLISLVVLSETSPVRSRRRADESAESGHNKKSKSKGDSSASESDADSGKKDVTAEKQEKAHKSIESSDDNNDDDDHEKLHSTRGLKPEDFEPEEGPRGYAKNDHMDDDESDVGSNRRKRSINLKLLEEAINKHEMRKLENQ